MIYEKASTKFTIARYTTPTITFALENHLVSNLDNAKLNLRVRGEQMITKAFTDATVNTTANTISWTLTQSDTATLPENTTGEVYCSWLIGSTRGRSKFAEFLVVAAGEEGVMTSA